MFMLGKIVLLCELAIMAYIQYIHFSKHTLPYHTHWEIDSVKPMTKAR